MLLLGVIGMMVNRLVIYPKVIECCIRSELPFMATKSVIMVMVKKGVDCQECHEEIHVLSHQAAAVVKQEGGENDLIEHIRNTAYFAPVKDDLDELLRPETFIGRAPEQVDRFVEMHAKPALAPYANTIAAKKPAKLSV